ncbi:ent-cassadiene C11-alpha-hydroxylase 1-like [Miscanthus floridulus]|uniref:ent-cassadiene C11-alpha-hydroxylase 1-like n=1 Tax=Miscanthus floridulus TaxID=154761 RepID=UPI0034596D9E
MTMPHLAMSDGAEVRGFAAPAGTTVIINLWAIMRDPESWAEPEAFVPERFVGGSDTDFRGKDRLEFMPFGAGRRACPGTPMATRVVTLLLASMLHAFEWKLPEGKKDCYVPDNLPNDGLILAPMEEKDDDDDDDDHDDGDDHE